MNTARSGPGNGLPAGVYAEAVRQAATRKSPAEALAAVIDMAVTSGPGEQASITMRTARSVESVAYSSDLVLRADQLQYELDEGPCLDAVWTDGVLVVPDLVADGRWPRWAPAAARLGVGSSVSVHLFTDTALGSLNLYSLHPRDYGHADLEAAKVIGAHASVVLAYARNRAEPVAGHRYPEPDRAGAGHAHAEIRPDRRQGFPCSPPLLAAAQPETRRRRRTTHHHWHTSGLQRPEE